MRLWKLEPMIAEDEGSEWFIHGGYDCAQGFIVRAASEQAARQLVVDARTEPDRAFPDGYPITGSEGPEVWLDPTATRCTPIDSDGEPAVLLRDFLHG